MMRSYRLLGIVLLLFGSRLGAQYVDMAKFQEALRQPLTVTNQLGQQFVGVPVTVDETQLVLKVFSGVGEAEIPIRRDEISGISIPGSEFKHAVYTMMDQGKYALALEVLHPLLAQRIKLLPILPEDEALFFAQTVDALIAVGKPVDALAVSMRLKPFISDQATIQKLDEAIIIGHYCDPLVLREDARKLAEEWVADAERFGSSALGWWILAQIEYDSENYLAARRIALNPAALSGQLPMRYLPHCYAVAIAAAHAMEDFEHAQLLFEEMQERGLEWPEIEALVSIQEHYHKNLPAD